MKKSLILGVLAVAFAAGTAHADTSGKRIAFSNNYAGNSWRQAMLKSYDIVTKGHGGQLKLESKQGKGTEFIVILPV